MDKHTHKKLMQSITKQKEMQMNGHIHLQTYQNMMIMDKRLYIQHQKKKQIKMT